jgi:hypothetical protein
MAASLLVRTDYENNSEGWWDSLRAVADDPNCDPGVRQAVRDVLRHDAVELSDPRVIEAFDRLAHALPGWDDPDAPEHAPHPLTFEAV